MRLWRSLREILGDGERMRTILHLAWPTVVEQALQTVVSYADTAQVGAIGAQASASVGLTTSMMWLAVCLWHGGAVRHFAGAWQRRPGNGTQGGHPGHLADGIFGCRAGCCDVGHCTVFAGLAGGR